MNPRRLARRGRRLGIAFSLLAHLSIVLALLLAHDESPRPPEPSAMTVTMIDDLDLVPKAAASATAQPSPARALPRRTMARPSLAPSDIAPLPADEPGPGLSDAQLAGAATAGGGGGGAGGTCDMAGRVQSALRQDPLVQSAVAASAGQATLVWSGDWVRSRGEDGKGLAAVREAIMWAIAFAPEPCRAQPMRGLVLLSVTPAAGAVRLAVGADQWRWSDLLGLRR
jgi:hypothetical protein